MKKMKTTLTLIVLSLLAVSLVMPTVLAIDTGIGLDIDITTEDFAPMVWMCDSRVVADDYVEWGRFSEGGDELLERINNYAFTGESISWRVLVLDKNGADKVKDVYVTVGSTQGDGNPIEANCEFDDVLDSSTEILDSCNAMVGQADLAEVFHENTLAYYDCTLTVETADSMAGEMWVTVEAEDNDGLLGTMAENEYWFFNPIIGLDVTGSLAFSDVTPGTYSYSPTLTVQNDAEAGSGVMLDMFISGTNFYDSASSGAKCPTTNELDLSSFRYFATNGAYSTLGDEEDDGNTYDPAVTRDSDAEGYVNIQHGDHFDRTMYEEAEILQDQQLFGLYYPANILAPGAEMSLTFRLNLPEPCNGDFDTGSIFFWGEAI